jgi:hypothetical protein
MLIEHPRICPCRTKEPQFFCKEQTVAYEDLWEYDEDRHVYSLEASTNYTKHPMVSGVPDRIHAYGLKPKFIYLVRDPIDRIESQYNFMVNNRGVHAEEFKETRIVANSMYYMQLQQFLQVFPDRDQYLILDFDTLISEPTTVVAACMEFLGLEPPKEISEKASNRTATTVSDVLIQRTGTMKNKVGRLLSDEMRTRIKRWLRHLTPSVERHIDSAERKRLQSLLRHDIEKFGATFDVNVSKWGF